MGVMVEVPRPRIRACQLPMGVRRVLSDAGVTRLRSLLLCTKLADLSHEQCARQTRREGPASSAAGLYGYD